METSLLAFTTHPRPRNAAMRDGSIDRRYVHAKKYTILNIRRSQSLTIIRMKAGQPGENCMRARPIN